MPAFHSDCSRSFGPAKFFLVMRQYADGTHRKCGGGEGYCQLAFMGQA